MILKIVSGLIITYVLNALLTQIINNLNIKHKINKKIFALMYLLVPLLIIVVFKKNTLYPFNYQLLASVFFVVLLAYIAIVDLYIKLIPNILLKIQLIMVILFTCLDILSQANFSAQFLKAKLITLLLTGGSFFIVYLITKGALGAGDVRLMTILGITFNQNVALAALFYSLISCAVISIALMILRKLNSKDNVPFAPFILVGTILSILQLT
ncbi:prepilin peptidase [Clostridium sp. 'deep sea']|uniref:prepilin peptidase n=1 Tax=Clostridium sp. 'deep sea' TaxID=2779445 RepID=UPI0018967A2E|nr:prepilin peptidase [Clostridium sp. 'deep sea']QOR33661.1 prepilin peptidase [Clostridium sp. 'deep sea']